MRRIASILTVLFLVGPAWADVEITLTDLGDGEIEIGYDASTEAYLIRSFALDIVATDGNIIDIDDYSIGDDNGGYGIFPGSFGATPIDVNIMTGEVENWAEAGYSPITPDGAPEALGGLGTSGITVEFAALYDAAAPGKTGVLCTITVDENVTELCLAANARRNNVLLENGDEAILTPAEVCVNWEPDCFPNTAGYERQFNDWIASGKPDCWCEAFQCDGDAITETQVIGWRVYTSDLVRLANNWQKKIGDPGFDPCADFDHAGQVIGWRTYTNDLVILANNWQKKDHQLPGDCPRPE